MAFNKADVTSLRDAAHHHHRVTFSDQLPSAHASSALTVLQHQPAANTAGTAGDLEAQHDSASSTGEAAQQQQYGLGDMQHADVDPLGRPTDLSTEHSVPIPLSEVRLPVSALAPNSCDDKHHRHQKKHSFSSSGSGKTGKTGKTGVSGVSNFLSEKGEEIHEAAHNFKLHVNHPQQVCSRCGVFCCVCVCCMRCCDCCVQQAG